VHVESEAASLRFGVERGDILERGGADAMRHHAERLAARIALPGELIHLLPVCSGFLRREAPLRALERPADPAGGVKRVEQYQPDPGGPGGLEHYPVVLVISPASGVVQVVKFAAGS